MVPFLGVVPEEEEEEEDAEVEPERCVNVSYYFSVP